MSKASKAYLNEVYKDPLPLNNVVPLPQISYHNPLSIISFLYQYLFPCNPVHHTRRLKGTIDANSRSVVIHDTHDATQLWTHGFFGKGQFSRSEPSWYTRTQRSLGLIRAHEKLTPEEITARRRIARAQMKAERAKREKTELLAQLKAEGKLSSDNESMLPLVVVEEEPEAEEEEESNDRLDAAVDDIPNLENLQLTLFEALFLSLALDILDIYDPQANQVIPKTRLLPLFTDLYGGDSAQELVPDDMVVTNSMFLINYAVYHHYRSLGWTVKPGVKFGIDWLLYKRGPVFGHAEFSIVVMPSPRRRRRQQQHPQEKKEDDEERPWWWLHMLTRVNGQVKKTIILTYVDYEERALDLEEMSLQDVLGHYKVREVSVKRWIPSRNRD